MINESSRLAIEDVIAERRLKLFAMAPARRSIVRMEIERIGGAARPEIVASDAGNRNRTLPSARIAIGEWNGTPANEAELVRLRDDAADRSAKTARLRAVDDDFGNSKLTFERLGARFMIDGRCKTVMRGIARVWRREICHKPF